MPERTVVGQRVQRVDALEKVTGRAKYASDVQLQGMLHGAFVRSPHAHAVIKRIDTSAAENLPGVRAVITQASLAAGQVIAIEEEMHATRRVLTMFAQDKVRYHGEKVAVIAADTREIAEEAAELVVVEYEPLTPLTDVREAVKPDAPVIFEGEEAYHGPDGNLLRNAGGEFRHEEGDVEAGFSEADRVFENTYVVPRAHQTYIEPQVAVADVDPSGKVTLWTSTQGHFAVRSNLANSLRIPLNKINVHGMTVGGGFGAKFGGIIDTYAVLLSQHTGRPVKLVYNRQEEFLDGRPAPGAVITIKTGVKNDGTITTRQAFGLWDTGVSGGGSGSTRRIMGVYDIPNVKIDAYDIRTNKPAPGAYRAPGGPQASGASEMQLDEIAHALGLDPVDFRIKNMKEGPEVDFKATLKAVADHVDWPNRDKDKRPNQGWGVAIGEWTNGAGPGGAVVSVHEDGSVKVFSGLMDLTGTDTAMAQIAAEVLGVPYESVVTVRGDTDSAPYATASGGSVVTFSMGNAVKRGAEDARARVLELASEHLGVHVDQMELRDAAVVDVQDPENTVTLAELAQAALRTTGGPIVGRGTFSAQPSATTIAAQIAKVEVDRDTGQVKLLQVAGSLDVGCAINPMAVEGQMEGGALQGMAWGLWERMQYGSDGRNINPNLVDYRVPTAMDVPYMDSVIIEVPTKNGPFGAKGVGEPPISPGIAAISNAVYDAVGVRITEAPLTPERVYFALYPNGGTNGG
jgi:CO/xanthine dehydrogenase Mo-binding subunit